ncbi:hypothetical protein BD289DRAFT_211126 [Coniella lustricola]|uniref:Uncharacterized protein n=1 Tax=Coniella lustricola TaxID=2025994 RepID=A0A2T3ABU1_9PEZI|nr:hypothetical protein BD289DRAFT_211126 [Coniella lustricola]
MPAASPLSTRQIWFLIVISLPAASAMLARVYIMRNVASSTSHRIERKSGENHKLRSRWKATKTADSSSSSSSSSVDIPPPLPHCFPSSLLALNNSHGDMEDGDHSFTDYIVWYERVVSKPVLLSSLQAKSGKTDGRDCQTGDRSSEDQPTTSKGKRISLLLTDYARATMSAFTRTPQAALLQKLVPEDAKRTFGEGYIAGLDFETLNQRVDGLYTVQYRGDVAQSAESLELMNEDYRTGKSRRQRQRQKQHRVELKLDPPEGYLGPKGGGVIVVAVEVEQQHQGGPDQDAQEQLMERSNVCFVNETWLWRKESERPMILESVVGRWVHSLMAGWLITSGITALRGSTGK